MPEYGFVDRIKKIYSVERGCTCPAHAILNDGTEVILKYPKNQLGVITLVNEYIAYHVAKAVNLTSPNFKIVNIGDNIVLDLEVAATHTVDEFVGVGFACEYIPAAVKASRSVLQATDNLKEACKMILFDEVIKISDRHEANVIISTNKNDPKMYAIDHSHAFGDPDWDSSTLSLGDADSPYVWRENFAFYNLLERAGAPMSLEDFDEARQVFTDSIKADLLENIIGEIPTEWRTEVGEGNLQSVKNYILYRVDSLDKICEMIMRERGV